MAKYEKGVFWARTTTVMTVEVLVFRSGSKAAALRTQLHVAIFYGICMQLSHQLFINHI